MDDEEGMGNPGDTNRRPWLLILASTAVCWFGSAAGAERTITFTFEPTAGEAVRIVGTPGGSKRFTTILELEGRGELYNGPRAEAVMIGDGETPLTQVSAFVVKFSEPVTILIRDVELVRGSAVVDMKDTLLLQTLSRRAALVAMANPLPAGAYELRLHCAAIVDDFGLSLIDDDDNPADALHTTHFDIVPAGQATP